MRTVNRNVPQPTTIVSTSLELRPTTVLRTSTVETTQRLTLTSYASGPAPRTVTIVSKQNSLRDLHNEHRQQMRIESSNSISSYSALYLKYAEPVIFCRRLQLAFGPQPAMYRPRSVQRQPLRRFERPRQSELQLFERRQLRQSQVTALVQRPQPSLLSEHNLRPFALRRPLQILQQQRLVYKLTL